MADPIKVDCSEFAQTISEYIHALAKRGDVKTLDDAVKAVQELDSAVTRRDVVDGITEHRRWLAAKRRRKGDTLVQKMRDMARFESDALKLADELERQLKSGSFDSLAPPRKQREAHAALKAVKDRIVGLKKARKERIDLLNKIEKVKKDDETRGIREDINKRERLSARRDELNERIANNDTTPRDAGGTLGPDTEAVSALKDEVKGLEKELGRIRRAKDAPSDAEKQAKALERRERATEKRIAELKDKIAKRDTASSGRGNMQGPQPERLSNLIEERDSLNRQMDDLRIEERLAEQIELAKAKVPSAKKDKREDPPHIADMKAQLSRIRTINRIEADIEGLKSDARSAAPFPAMNTPQMNKLHKIDEELTILRGQRKYWLAKRKEYFSNSDTLAGKIWGFTADASRLMQSTGEVSFLGRQMGKAFKVRFLETTKQLNPMARAMFSEKEAIRLQQEFEDDPIFNELLRVGFVSQEFGGGGKDSNEIFRGEFIRRWAKTKKTLGVPLDALERAFSVGINYVRRALYLSMTDSSMSLENKREVMHQINIMTGRGSVAPITDKAADLANVIAYSARYELSKWQFAAESIDALTGGFIKQGVGRWTGTLAKKADGTWATRADLAKSREIMRNSMLRIMSANAVITGALVSLGYMIFGEDDEDFTTYAKKSVEFDPRSSMFGKVKMGDNWVDIREGTAAPWVLAARLLNGHQKNARTGKITPIRESSMPWDRPGMKPDYGATESDDLLKNYARSKLAPLPSKILDALDGEDVVGNRQNIWSAIQNLYVPITYSNILKAYEDNGVPAAVATGIIEGLGFAATDVSGKPSKEAVGAYERAYRIMTGQTPEKNKRIIILDFE